MSRFGIELGTLVLYCRVANHLAILVIVIVLYVEYKNAKY